MSVLPSSPEAAVQRGRTAREGVLTLIITAATFLWLHHTAVVPMTEIERSRDLLSARDCATLGQCALVGPPSSTFQLYQGAVWIEILTLVTMLGGSVVAALNVTTLLLSLGVGTVFMVTWRWLRPALAFPSALLTIVFIERLRNLDEFVNPSTAFFPSSLACAFLLMFSLTGRLRCLAMGAMAVALASNTHTSGLCLVPLLVILAAVAGPLGLALAAVAFLGVFEATSAETLRRDLLESTLDWRWLTGGVLLLAVVSRLAAARFRALSKDGRAVIAAAGMLVPFFCYLPFKWSQGLGVGGSSSWLYFPPVMAPTAVAIVALLTRALERLGGLARMPTRFAQPLLAAVAMPWLVMSARVPVRNWNFDDAHVLERHLEGLGWTYSRMARGVQTADLSYFRIGILDVAPQDKVTEPSFDSRHQFRVWRETGFPAHPRSNDAETLVLGDGTSLFLSRIDSWLDPWQADVCVKPTRGAPRTCNPSPPSPDSARPFLFSNRLFADDRGGLSDQPEDETCAVSYVIPVRPTTGGRRWLSVTGGWVFSSVDGFDFTGSLPAPNIALHSLAGTAGHVTIELTRQCPEMIEYPGIFEATPEDPPWMTDPWSSRPPS